MDGRWPSASQGDRLHRGDISRQLEDCRARLQVDELCPTAGEVRRLIEPLVDPIDLAVLTEGALLLDHAPVAAATGDIGRPGDSVSLLQRLAIEVRRHP